MDLSVVIPIHDEAPVLAELVARVRTAAVSCAETVEVLLIDDASRDETASLAASLSDDVVRFVHLSAQHGQTGATLAGIALARGALTVVLDGDLQDPPEHIAALVAALRERSDCDVAFAVKSSRGESPGARAAFALYHLAQRAFGDGSMPPGAGSYCAFRASVREAVMAAPRSRANVATLVGRRGARHVEVPYEKAARPRGVSQVGVAGLTREALDSLAMTGALSRLVVAVGALATAVAVPCVARRRRVQAALTLGIATLAARALARGYERRLGREDVAA